MTGHSWKSIKGIPWLNYCGTCGLVHLDNYISQWCTKRGCDYRDDPGYSKMLKTLVRQWQGEKGLKET